MRLLCDGFSLLILLLVAGKAKDSKRMCVAMIMNRWTIMYGGKFWKCYMYLWICVYECKGIIMWEWALLGLMEFFGVWFWWEGNKRKKKIFNFAMFVCQETTRTTEKRNEKKI